METKYITLINAYSEQNLTELTAMIISLYKSGNKSVFTQIVQILSDFVKIHDGNMAKIFSQLIMLVHPDKSASTVTKINTLIEQRKYTSLKPYMFILELDDFDEIVQKFSSDEDIELNEDEVWEEEEDSYDYFEDDEDIDYDYDDPDEFDFYHAVKKKVYGNRNVNFPAHYLEDYEEIEMSDYGITNLAGVENCKYLKKLFLSNNDITDISELMNLEYIEELYLSKNQIGFIDSLESLENLRILDLSFNNVDDISPLMDLENLEFVNLLGNNVDSKQIQELKEKEILVVY